jgi:hypothetical protein
MNKSIFTKKQQLEVDNFAYVCYTAWYKKAFGRKPNRARFMKAVQEDKVKELYKEISEKMGIDFKYSN